MTMSTTQKTVAVVTGCSSGIGEALALELASRDVVVVATARKVESLSHLTKKFDTIIPVALELGNLSSLESFRDTVAKKTGGRVDILVNNAGTHYASTAEDLDVAEAEKLFTVNLFAVMRLCQLFLPMLRESPSGRIVQIGSVTRGVPVPWQSVYNASKAALSQYTKTLRLELRPFGVDVIEIVTGYVRSNILHHGLYAPDDSLYLPVKDDIERIKNDGNRHGMPAAAYAKSVVSEILRDKPRNEFWEGNMATLLRTILSCCPLWLSDWFFYRNFNLQKLEAFNKRLKDKRGCS